MPTLSMTAFKGAVAKGPLAPVYVFHGADDHHKDAWVRRVIEAATDAGTRDFNLESLRGGECDVARLAGALDALPMLAERRVVVVRDPGALKKAVQVRLATYLKRPAPETVLLLVVPAGETPAAAWTAAASVVEFRALEGEDLVKWIIHHTTTVCGGTIQPAAAVLLAAYGGSDLALLDGELRKLVAFTAGTPIDEAAVEAVTGVRPGHTVGDFLEAVARRETVTALTLVEDALAQPKSSGVTLVMALTTQTLAIGWGLAARARGLPASRLESEFFTLLKGSGGAYTGLPWGEAVKCWARNLSRWSSADVDRALAQLREADRAMKDTKVSSEAQLLRSLVLGMAAVPARARTTRGAA